MGEADSLPFFIFFMTLPLRVPSIFGARRKEGSVNEGNENKGHACVLLIHLESSIVVGRWVVRKAGS
ncbi:MAG: hypothetical protein ACTSUE_21375 [Promethearchaeota archaeon]